MKLRLIAFTKRSYYKQSNMLEVLDFDINTLATLGNKDVACFINGYKVT